VEIGFRADRALWRDSLALIQMSEERVPPGTARWIGRLVRNGYIDYGRVLPMDLFGVKTDPRNAANVLFWRHERLSLPVSYLDDSKLCDELSYWLGAAEKVAGVLGQVGTTLALLIRHPNADPRDARLRRDKAVADLADRLGLELAYWASLDSVFRSLLEDLPTRRGTAGESWAGEVRGAARRAFADATDALASSPRTIRAVAVAENELGWRLRRALVDYLPKPENAQEVLAT
jgi:hypothetical protein